MTTRKPAAKTNEQKLVEECEYLRGQSAQWERMYRAEYDARQKLVAELATLKERERVAEMEAAAARLAADTEYRRRSFAEGFISALKGDAYTTPEVAARDYYSTPF